MSGLLVENIKRNVQISSDVTPLTYSHKIEHDFKVNNALVPMGNENESFSVWHRGDSVSRIQDIGLFQAFYNAPISMGKRLYDQSAVLQVSEYVFDTRPAVSSGLGLQLFNAAGVETYNSEKPLLSIIDSVSINVADGYNKEVKKDSIDSTLFVDRTRWAKTYAGYSKLGILFKNVPGGISKTSSIYQIWAYFYNFRTAGNLVELEYRPEYWSYSQTSSVIDLDLNLKLEFFVIDLSNVA